MQPEMVVNGKDGSFELWPDEVFVLKGGNRYPVSREELAYNRGASLGFSWGRMTLNRGSESLTVGGISSRNYHEFVRAVMDYTVRNDQQPAVTVVVQQPGVPVAPALISCSYCGTRVEPAGRCSHCGAPVAT